ncbi:unnamed protein product [Caenorhabditis nigoni]
MRVALIRISGNLKVPNQGYLADEGEIPSPFPRLSAERRLTHADEHYHEGILSLVYSHLDVSTFPAFGPIIIDRVQ